MPKMDLYFFVLFLKWIETKIFTFKDFRDFVNRAHFLLLKEDQILIRLSLEHKELRPVEIFRLSFIVPEI
jgi:hypothetical protein